MMNGLGDRLDPRAVAPGIALALGANGICIGRAYIWGLAAFGQAGVERVLDMLRVELMRIMKFAGTTSIAAIGREHVQAKDWPAAIGPG